MAGEGFGCSFRVVGFMDKWSISLAAEKDYWCWCWRKLLTRCRLAQYFAASLMYFVTESKTYTLQNSAEYSTDPIGRRCGSASTHSVRRRLRGARLCRQMIGGGHCRRSKGT